MKWEYIKIDDFTDGFYNRMDRLGKDGWELVSVVHRQNKVVETLAFFKRPLREDV